jgi:carboxylesterase
MEAKADDSASFELGGGDDACLLLHGFTGSPWDMRPLGDALARSGYRVRGPRLPGHGVSPEAMLDVSWRDWERAAEDALQSLDGAKRVFVSGLSMGALLGLILAARHPTRVHGLALIAPAVRFLGPVMSLLRATRHLHWLERVKPWVAKTATDISDPEALARAPILPRFPSARLQDLWVLQDRAREAMAQVKAPTLIAVARHDHVVDPRAGLAMAKQLTGAATVKTRVLENSFHIIPRDRDGAALADEVGRFFEGLRR